MNLNIAVQCSPNFAHHPHVIPIVDNLLLREGVNIYIYYLDSSDLHCFLKYKNNENVFFIQSGGYVPLKFGLMVEFFIRYFRNFLTKINDLNLELITSFGFLKKMDAIIFTDLVSGRVIKRINPSTKVIWALHGPIASSHMASKSIEKVDIILTQGRQTSECFYKSGVSKEKVKEIGSVKLSSFNSYTDNIIFNNNRKTVLYNPHFNSKLGGTSWIKFGYDLIEYIAKSKEYNLIFAPHPNLSNNIDRFIIDKYRNCENVIIDLGSNKVANLFYCEETDIYIGDISSQVLEFIYLKERKLIFFDDENVSDESKRIHELGVVIERLDELSHALTLEFTEENKLRQRDFINNVFSNNIDSSAKAASDIIYESIWDR
ncbi:Glycosyl glycerophosphate transferases involved in teichoic acid biosynthesis TagF TagB EpsJ RodC [Vibrio sp. B1ASS3]|uniref:CDP-glycerol glycerophosphotransferase family protein n=2 Tax=Vibrio sp. B1ASS3 TaxID=2751176 RepID=UPI001AFCA472|nr:CDP-glycerol glycerophosphotransferase family protein [Vibrio sp. B1ASS3]CAD7817376.1 Glycosyl glycerophosphate transferases involved in teichoic acid biosynthesis TagF TagB EpsJ RodC [Vibrio sp. B1ASS3]CAE6931151.1 Glycosyl glycerophosphate transferases involved in teichoic acid biosynthesis TagF TagB EpsJ RodC [Vibrio sp. B1ASS3]